jgi:hypothetical protein
MIHALRTPLAAVILTLCFAAPAVAGPLEDAFDAFGKRDYATALRLLRPLADRGDATAQNQLGLMYNWGLGVPKNEVEAAKIIPSPRTILGSCTPTGLASRRTTQRR